MRQVVHNNVVRYFDADVDGERCFCVTQFLEGLTLRKIIDLRKDKGQRFSLSEVEPICAQLCDALASEDCEHGGLKPENVIILPDVLKVTDFRLAEALPRQSYLAGQRACGHAARYLAPEVRQGRAFDTRADIFSIATIVHELLSGTLPADNAPTELHELDPEIPAAIDDVLTRALSELPQTRQTDVETFGQDLAAAMGGQSPQAGLTLRFGSPVPISKDPTPVLEPAGAALADDDDEGDDLLPEGDDRLTLPMSKPDAFSEHEVSAASEPSESSRSEPIPSAPETTQQLGVDELEVIDDEQEDLELTGSVSRASTNGPMLSGSRVQRVFPRPRSESHPSVAVTSAPDGTQQLSVDEVEFESSAPKDVEAVHSDPGDREVTIPKATWEETLGAPPSDSAKDLFMDQGSGAFVAGPPSDKTQQIDPAMIIDGDIDDDEPLSLQPSTASSEQFASSESQSSAGRAGHAESHGRDHASASGETESSFEGTLSTKAPTGDLPRQNRSAVDREARARDALSAFHSSSEEIAIEPAEAPAVVAPEVLSEDAVPEPLDTASAIDEPAPVREPRSRPSRRTPILIATVLGLVAGSLGVLVYALVSGDKKPVPTVKVEEKQGAAPTTPANTKVQPLVTSAKPSTRDFGAVVQTADSGVQHDAASSDAASDGAVTPDALAADSLARDSQAAPKAKQPFDQASKDKPLVAKKSAQPKKTPTSIDRKRKDRASKLSKKAPPKAKTTKKLAAKPTPEKKKPESSSKKCHAGMVFMKGRGGSEGYCIDRYEAPGRGRRPLRGVSLGTARAKCRARGMRLCSAREWMRACAGLFPYGRVYDAKRCNTGASGTVAAGSKRRCRSRYGVYDLSGNVSEWVSSGSAMGGHFASAQGHASCTARAAGGANTGYRCCSDPRWD
jgi:hypothetical protein